jgi:excisionase family DNA binding protein
VTELLEAGGVEQLWTVADLAEHMRVSRWMVYKLAQANAIPVIRVGQRHLRFDPADIRAALAARQVQPRVAERVGNRESLT